MARVLVVSRNAAMAMGLSATDHLVTDLRPQAFGEWIAGEDDADALILDLESPALAAAAVTNLRAHAKHAPVLLVSSDRPGWHSAEMQDLPAALVLPLPINRPGLLSALDELLQASWAPAVPPAPFLPEVVTGSGDTFRTAEALDDLQGEDTNLVSDDDLERLIVTPRHAAAENLVNPAADAAASTVEAVPVAESSPPLTAVPRTRRSTALPSRSTTSHVLDDLERLRVSVPPPDRAPVEPRRSPAKAHRRPKRTPQTKVNRPASPEVVPKFAQHGAESGALDPVGLVRALTTVTDQLFGVPETAEVVIADAVASCGADAGALLVPDHGDWRVAAGRGLRPLEYRYELRGESWLVQEIACGHRGAIIEESDIARERLQGAPLASWRHLLAAPVPNVEALLILARREDPPFDEENLRVLATLGEEAAPLLGSAIDTRTLARCLREFRDEVDRPR